MTTAPAAMGRAVSADAAESFVVDVATGRLEEVSDIAAALRAVYETGAAV